MENFTMVIDTILGIILSIVIALWAVSAIILYDNDLSKDVAKWFKRLWKNANAFGYILLVLLCLILCPAFIFYLIFLPFYLLWKFLKFIASKGFKKTKESED